MSALALIFLLAPTTMRKLALWNCAWPVERGPLAQCQKTSVPTLCGALEGGDAASVRASIDVLATMPGKRILVLGEMSEMHGMDAAAEIGEIGSYAKRQGVDVLFAMGEQGELAARSFGAGARYFYQANLLMTALNAELTKDSAVLVKGTRFECSDCGVWAAMVDVVDAANSKRS